MIEILELDKWTIKNRSFKIGGIYRIKGSEQHPSKGLIVLAYDSKNRVIAFYPREYKLLKLIE